MKNDRFYDHAYSLPFQRQVWEATLKNTTTHYPIARRDPIFTPIFTAVFTQLGVTGTIFGVSAAATLGSLTTAIVTTAISIGIQMALAPKPPKPEDGKVPKSQGVPYRIWTVGRLRLAGSYMLWEASGKNLFAVQAIAGHRIKSVNRYWLHDDEVEIDANGFTTNDDGGRYGNNVRIQSRIGAPTETAYAPLVAELGASGIWTNNHRGDGQTSVMMIAESTEAKNQQKRFPFGPPSLSVEVDGALCWDYRDLAQDPNNPATWGWTRNSALILAWHECFNEFGSRRDYRKAILPVLDMWIEEADICDEDVPLAGGGTEKRYQCNGWDTTENSPKVGTNAILATCDGWMAERGDGALLLTVGKFRETRVGTLTDADIIGHQIQYDVLFEDECNRLIPKFTYPATDYSTCDTDFFEDTAAQLSAGRVLAQEGDYGWCHQWRQARRLGKRDWLRIQQKVKGSIDVRLSGINAIYSRWIRLDTPIRLPRLNGKLIENRRALLSLMKGGFSMEINQHPENIEDWNPSVDEGMQPPVPASPDPDAIPTPVINLIQAQANNGSVFIRVIIIDPVDDSLTPAVRYRVQDIGAGVAGAWVTQTFDDAPPSGGFISMNTNAVPVDVTLDVEAAFIGSNDSYGEWSPIESLVSTADPTPPGVVTGASATGGAGQATYNWTAPNSPNYGAARLYWNTVNNFSTATAVSPTELGAPGLPDSHVVTGLSAGVKFGWIVALNRSGIGAAAVATGSFTVT
ncbi:hypothetical protein [Rhizobium leucaenae]|uniref:hypothetical protein n=1 Tax=Rhizobium leucaenae TaxID=29450 RepID=UPI0003F62566|nr:hypothetical protein [Rhizobium leucaenae]